MIGRAMLRMVWLPRDQLRGTSGKIHRLWATSSTASWQPLGGVKERAVNVKNTQVLLAFDPTWSR
jgi:hypothetical protein